MEPLTSGNYPQSMRSLLGRRLPKFTKQQVKLINGSFDFLGLNYYTSNYVVNAPKLSNGKPNYATDSNANLTSKDAFVYHFSKLYIFFFFLIICNCS